MTISDNTRKRCLRILGLVVLLGAMALLFGFHYIEKSLPQRTGTIHIPQMSAPVTIKFDKYSVPSIHGNSQLDVSRSLGFITAGDRLFQMDLIRRKTSGQLAEIFGKVALASDIQQRHLNFTTAAKKIVSHLPKDQLAVLKAYSQGVNDYLAQTSVLPPEFLLLAYQPRPWTPEDSILVALSMFQMLSWTNDEERMLSIMDASLSDHVIKFFTPNIDDFSKILTGGEGSARPIVPIPIAELSRLRSTPPAAKQKITVVVNPAIAGSNHWAVNHQKTSDGRAIIANDMHLPLSVPNIWYRANLRYDDVQLAGVILPGLPVLVAGSNKNVSWGFTNAMADVMDLVKLKLNPVNPNQYLSPEGWKRFDFIRHEISIKNHTPTILVVKQTQWGPVLPSPLLNSPVALKWTALEPSAVNMGLMYMDRADSVGSGVTIIKNAGGPPMNVLLADSQGAIAWTLMGKFPLRLGFDGSVSQYWNDSKIQWQGYIPTQELPYVIDPDNGFLVTANNQTLGTDYPHTLGHNYLHSYRAYRISERLTSMNAVTEKDLFDLQLDTRSEFYDFYQKLAQSLLDAANLKQNPELIELKDEIDAWNGHADADSRGLSLLIEFRNTLAQSIIPAYLNICKHTDKQFKYKWFELDTPLRQLLSEKNPKTLPGADKFKDWNSYLLTLLIQSTNKLKQNHQLTSLKKFAWGQINQAELAHPLSKGIPFIGSLINMPKEQMSGCGYCVRVIQKNFGASERFVISPGYQQQGFFNMPTGQSGNPLSKYYSDQQHYWSRGIPLPFSSNKSLTSLRLTP